MFKGTLLPYQVEAVDRMCERGSMLVAYDLGLGKTVLTLAAVERLMDEGKVTEPGIVVCLSSLKYQWASSVEKFTDSKALVIDGTPKQRQAQYEQAMDWQNSGVDYVILNYEQIVNDWKIVSKLPRGFVVADEATAIKSFRAKRAKLVKKLKCDYTYALTGTPLENGKPEELYSIMQFVDASVLGRFDLFDQTFIVRNHFGGVDRYRNLPVLHKTMAKASVRKRQDDADVAPYLPATIFPEPMFVPFEPSAKRLYNKIVEDLVADLDEAMESFGSSFDLFKYYSGQADSDVSEFRGRIMSKLTALRMLCDHPQLLKDSAAKFLNGTVTVTNEDGDDLTTNIPGYNGGSSYAAELDATGWLEKITKAPKLDALKAYVDDFLSQFEGNKVVIFTSYVSMVDLIAEALSDYGPTKYTGQMNAKEKEASKVHFQTDPDCRVLVSSDAGGYGVDLPQANLLINYDLPWNAGLAVQRNGRIRRASSTWKSVVIQDLLMKGSVEERQHAMLQQKLSVASAIIDGEGINEKGGVNLTVGSLREFLVEVSV